MAAPRCVVLALSLAFGPAAAWANLVPLSCVLTENCIAGQACIKTTAEFDLAPVPGGYGASIDAGWIELMQISPPEAQVKSFALAGPESVSVLLSLYPDGALALSVHEDIDGRYVETAFGICAAGGT